MKTFPTSLLGTHIGDPSLTIPASTATPITMGSRVLKICSVRTRSLHGNIAICLNSSRFFCFNSCHNKQYKGIKYTNPSVFTILAINTQFNQFTKSVCINFLTYSVIWIYSYRLPLP